MSVQAYILVQSEVGRADEVAAAIAGLSGVVQSESVTGPYDVVVRAEGKDIDELGSLVVSSVQKVPGITRTVTCNIVAL